MDSFSVECPCSPLFVTLKKDATGSGDLELRGCIGNLSPVSLARLGDYALKRCVKIWLQGTGMALSKQDRAGVAMRSGFEGLFMLPLCSISVIHVKIYLSLSLFFHRHDSAFDDRRFDPLEHVELPYLTCSVSFLVDYEDATRWDDWEIGTHGILITFDHGGRRYSATYLPEVAAEQGWNHHDAVRSLVRKAGFRGGVDDALLRSLQVTRYQSSKASCGYHEYARTRARD